MAAASSALTPRTGSAASSPKLTRDVHFRLAREDVDELLRIAEEDCIPLSAVARRFVVAELRRRRRFPDPLPLTRAGARDGNVRVG
jgi:hypothetical protein